MELMEEKKKRYVNKLLWMPLLYDYDLVCGSFFTDWCGIAKRGKLDLFCDDKSWPNCKSHDCILDDVNLHSSSSSFF